MREKWNKTDGSKHKEGQPVSVKLVRNNYILMRPINLKAITCYLLLYI